MIAGAAVPTHATQRHHSLLRFQAFASEGLAKTIQNSWQFGVWRQWNDLVAARAFEDVAGPVGMEGKPRATVSPCEGIAQMDLGQSLQHAVQRHPVRSSICLR